MSFVRAASALETYSYTVEFVKLDVVHGTNATVVPAASPPSMATTAPAAASQS